MRSVQLVGRAGDRMILRSESDFETVVWHLPAQAGMRKAVIAKPAYVVLNAALADGWTIDATPDPAAARDAQRRADASFVVVDTPPLPKPEKRPSAPRSAFSTANLPKPGGNR